MQFVSEWTTSDRKRLVVLAPEVLQLFKRHRQRFVCQTEAGGILLGHRRGSHIEIMMATPPMANDRRFAYLFEREPDGHAEAAVEAWQKATGTVDYVGEWHTHPQRIPTPSPTDRSEWGKLATQQKGKPLAMVVVGTRELRVELVLGTRQTPLVPLDSPEGSLTTSRK
jgi:integrative and conjugative element protein (TIGR02256 family)